MAAEEYTAHHAETLDTILHKWSWRRFEGMFRRHLLRKAREELRELRDMRIAAMDANTNFDSPDNQKIKEDRAQQLREVYDSCVKALYSKQPINQQEELESDPLFAPVVKRAGQMQQEINRPLAPQAGMGRKLLEAA